MRILLIQPQKAAATIGGEDVYLYEPLALEYVAAGVEEHEVRILDLRIDKNLHGTLESYSPDIVGITAYTVHVNVVHRLFEQIKTWNPNILTVVGGHHATLMARDFISPFIDLIVTGEGVAPFREIVKRFERGDHFDGIPGVAMAKGNELVGGDPQVVDDLDAFPFPNRALTAAYRRQYHSEWMKPLASIRTSKGCPYRCSFCALWKLTGGRYLRRKPERVVEELATIKEDFVFFSDDESLVDTGRMTTLAHLIRQSGIKKRYFLYGRSDTIARSRELLALWRSIGLERVFVGFEFFRDEDLALIRKGSTSAENEQAARILRDLGIEVYASFIVRPEFTESDFAAFGPYCEKLGLRFATFAVLTPLPGTDFYEQVKDRLITRNYDYVDFLHTLLPTRLPLKQFYEQYYQLYKHAIPFRRQLPVLTKYRLKEIPGIFATSSRVLNQLRTAYRDYGN